MSARTSPFSTIGTQLMYKSSGSTYTKLCDIKDYPDLGGTPERIQTTSLSESQHTYCRGVQDIGDMTFTANYTKAEYETIKALETGSHDFAVYFGNNGEDGKFGCTAELSVYIKGAGVNDVVEMQITLTPSTEIQPIT